MRKRITSVLLALLMLLSLVPAMGTTASAAGTETHPKGVNLFGAGEYKLGYYTDKFDSNGIRKYQKVSTSEFTGNTSDDGIWQAFTEKYAKKGVGWIYYIPETGILYIKGTIPKIDFEATTDDQDVLKVIVAGNATVERYIVGWKSEGECVPGLKKMTIDFRNGSTLTLSKNTTSKKKAILDITKTGGNTGLSYGDLELTGDGTLKIAPPDHTPNVIFGIRAKNISVLDDVSLDIKMGSRYQLMNPVSAAAITCDGKLNINTTGTVKIDVSEKIDPSAIDDRGYFKVFSDITNTDFNLTHAKSVTLKAREKKDTFVAYYDYVTGGENWYSTIMTALRNNDWTVTESAADASPYTVTMTRAGLSDAALNVGGQEIPRTGAVTEGEIQANGDKQSLSIKVKEPAWLKTLYNANRVDYNCTAAVYENGTKLSGNFALSWGGGTSTLWLTLLDEFKPTAGKSYIVTFSITPKVKATGEKLESAAINGNWLLTAVKKPDTVITSVNLTGNALKEGDTAGPTLTKADSDASYTVKTVTPWNITGSAAAGKEYYTNLFVKAADGYVFPTDWDQLRSIISVKLGDTPVRKLGISLTGDAKTLVLAVYAIADHVHSWSGEWKYDEDCHYKECTICKALSDKIPHSWGNWMNNDEDTQKRTCSDCGYSETRAKPERPISFLKINIIRPVAGATPSASDLTIRDAYKEQVEIVPGSVKWYQGETEFSGNFVKGQTYTIKAQFKAKGERIFANTITNASLFFTLDETKTLSTDKKTVDYSCTFTAYESVTVDTALPTLKVGEAMPLPTVSDGRAYTVFVMYNAGGLASLSYDSTENKWKDSSNAEVTGDGLKVKADTVYVYSYTIKEGDNEKVTAILTATGNSITSDATGNWVTASYDTSSMNKIASVDLNVTAPEYGKTPATSADVPAGANYSVNGNVSWSPKVTDNKFGTGEYTVSIPVTATTGYTFAEGCVYTVNGYTATYNDTNRTVSYKFPALTEPHTHNYGNWAKLDDDCHYQTCNVAGCDEPTRVAEHQWSAWTADTTDTTKHYKECSVCHHKVYADHEESTRIIDTEPTFDAHGTWHTECEVCHKQMNTGIIDKLVKIDVENLTVAKPVKDVAAAEATTTDAAYYVADTEWVAADGTTLAIGDKFKPGTAYTVKITLETAGDGVFSAASAYNQIAGKNATVSPKLTGDGYTETVILTYQFPATDTVVNPFTDVPSGSYYEDAVLWAVANGVTTGTDATHFTPDGVCTRAQAVTFLWRAAGSPAPKSGAMPFTDVKGGSYYEQAVLWAVENGITKGTSATEFSPEQNCSRAQIVTFLWRAENSPAAGTVNPFTDVKPGTYYADAVLWAVKENVTKGTTATTFSPDDNCTRAQIVTFIWRALAE